MGRTRSVSFLGAVALAAAIAGTGCWSGPRNTGWRCESNADCADGYKCRTFVEKKNGRITDGKVRVCSDGTVAHPSPYGWFHVVFFYVMILGLPGFVGGALLWDRHQQRRKKS